MNYTNISDTLDFSEAKVSQLPFVELLVNMGYTYVSRQQNIAQRQEDASRHIMSGIAAEALMRINSYEANGKQYQFSEKDVNEAISELENIQYNGLIDTSSDIYKMIMSESGKTFEVYHDGKKESKSFRFIDFDNVQNNSFHVSVEVESQGKRKVRPDIICYVNGIPLAIIENKKMSVGVEDAIWDHTRKQGPEYCPRLYTYAQLLISTNATELKYGTTGTPKKFYASWKERDAKVSEYDQEIDKLINTSIDSNVYSQILQDLDDHTRNHVQVVNRKITEQDKGVFSLLSPDRLLDISKNYILFDAGVKKVSRYQQYFAIKKITDRISEYESGENGIHKRKGGLVWHTQGSGKSLTMVLFIKALIESPDITNPRVIIVTDRKDLDKQIRDTFVNCNLKKDVTQASSGENLINTIKGKSLDVVTTLVHKFESASKKRNDFVDYDNNIFVLIDEAHRTQGGIANLEMNRTMPNACYIAFTGTPLMKEEKASWKKFGDYIDKYTIDDALEDEIILQLIYEGRFANLVQDKKMIDKHIERITKDLNEKQKAEIHKLIETKIIKDNPNRIAEIAYDIEQHYIKHYKGTGLKAQVVAPSKFSAVTFQNYFQESGRLNTAVIISDSHDKDDSDTHKVTVNDYVKEIKSSHSSLASFEEQKTNSFKNDEEGVELIIVVDKLLTGFDAPRNTVLYLAKKLKDHNLLQAIARVNRLFENKEFPKTAGFIIDYSENAQNIDKAMELFGNYDNEDVGGVLADINEKIADLENAYDDVYQTFKHIKNKSDNQEYLEALDDEIVRHGYYKKFNKLTKEFSECLSLSEFSSNFGHIDLYKKDIKRYLEIKKAASIRYADSVDLSEYKKPLISILDKYIDVESVERLTSQVNITNSEGYNKELKELIPQSSQAAARAAQTKKTIHENMNADPEFYKSFSDIIDQILQDLKQKKIDDLEAVARLQEVEKKVNSMNDDSLPERIASEGGVASVLYRNLGEFLPKSNEDYIEIVLNIKDIIKSRAIVDWYKSRDIKREIYNMLDDYIYDNVRNIRSIEFDNEKSDKLIKESIKLAEYNHDLI